MRIWDKPVRILCDTHLKAMHGELHGCWNILTIHGEKSRYWPHPETQRWIGRLGALWLVHELLAREMLRRGMNHLSPLARPGERDFGPRINRRRVNTQAEQTARLRAKGCGCRV